MKIDVTQNVIDQISTNGDYKPNGDDPFQNWLFSPESYLDKKPLSIVCPACSGRLQPFVPPALASTGRYSGKRTGLTFSQMFDCQRCGAAISIRGDVNITMDFEKSEGDIVEEISSEISQVFDIVKDKLPGAEQ